MTDQHDTNSGDEADLEEIAMLLADTVVPVKPASGARDLLMRRVAEWSSMKPLADVRSDEVPWLPAGSPLVNMRELFRDCQTGRVTMLVRMEPGATFPAHRHMGEEQCFVLRGDMRCGNIVYEEGDFVVMGRDTTHPEIRTAGGNLLLIITGRNEFIPA